MGTSHTNPNDWMTKDGTGKSTVFSDERGWVRKMADGQEIVIQCMTGVVGYNQPNITSIDNPAAKDYSIGSGEIIRFSVYFNEDINVTGSPVIEFKEAGVQQSASYNSGTSLSDMLTFEYTVANVGVIDNIIPKINLNGGIIISNDDGTAVDLDFPDNYVQPTGINVVA